LIEIALEKLLNLDLNIGILVWFSAISASVCHIFDGVGLRVGDTQAGWCVLIMRSSCADVRHLSGACATDTRSMIC